MRRLTHQNDSMSEDNTHKLTDGEKLILERIAKLEAHVQAQAEERAKTTRPLLDQLIREMTETRDMMMDELRAVNRRLDNIDHRLAVFSEDHMKMRGDIREHASRLAALEERDSRPN